MNPFTFDWDAPIADDERDRIFEKLVDQTVRRGLAVPVLWMLEIHKPFFPLLGQASIAFSPMLATFFAGGPEEMQRYTQVLRVRANVDLLIRRIEEKAEDKPLAARQ